MRGEQRKPRPSGAELSPEELARHVLTVARLELLRLRVPAAHVDEHLVRVVWVLLGWLSSAEAGEDG